MSSWRVGGHDATPAGAATCRLLLDGEESRRAGAGRARGRRCCDRDHSGKCNHSPHPPAWWYRRSRLPSDRKKRSRRCRPCPRCRWSFLLARCHRRCPPRHHRCRICPHSRWHRRCSCLRWRLRCSAHHLQMLRRWSSSHRVPRHQCCLLRLCRPRLHPLSCRRFRGSCHLPPLRRLRRHLRHRRQRQSASSVR